MKSWLLSLFRWCRSFSAECPNTLQEMVSPPLLIESAPSSAERAITDVVKPFSADLVSTSVPSTPITTPVRAITPRSRPDLFAPAYLQPGLERRASFLSPDMALYISAVHDSVPLIEASATLQPEPPTATLPTAAPDSVSDLLLLTNYLLFSEWDPMRLSDAAQRFLLPQSIRALTALLRDKVLELWRCGEGPLDPLRFYQLAASLSPVPSTALQLCYNVSRTFADGSAAIPWRKVNRANGVYSSGLQYFSAPANSDHTGLSEPSLLPALFCTDQQFEASDWHRYFASAWLIHALPTIPAYISRPKWLSDIHQTFLNFQGDSGINSTGNWTWSNALFFYESSKWGQTPACMLRQHRAAHQGALFGLSLLPGNNTQGTWRVPHPDTANIDAGWPIGGGAYRTRRMRLCMETIQAILELPSSFIRRSSAGSTFTMICTVHEGPACRFASSAWSDQILTPFLCSLIKGIGWKTIEHAARRQVVIRCNVLSGSTACAVAEIDLGRGFLPLPIFKDASE